MAVTALDTINKTLVKCGFGIVTATQVAADNNYPNKCYYQLLDAIETLTTATEDWFWNEPEETVTVGVGVDIVPIGTRVNPNVIYSVALNLTSDPVFLARTTRLRLTTEVFPNLAGSIMTNNQPGYFYGFNKQLRIFPSADKSYSVTYKHQQLPQSFAATAVETTNLDILDEIQHLLVGMTAWRLKEIIGDPTYLADFARYEDEGNPRSLLSKAIRRNKILEKNSGIRRIRRDRGHGLWLYS